jgi:hypothetical protein
MPEEIKHEPQMGLTFEKVWAMFQETDRKFQETSREIQELKLVVEENGRQMKDRAAETDRKFRETDRQIKEMSRKIGDLGGRFGDLIEHIIAPNLIEKFNRLGFMFGKMGTDVLFKDPAGKTLAEVDILLENGDIVMAVEVKSKLRIEYINDHISRMNKLRQYAGEHGDKRRLMGAVAGAVIPEGAKPFALKHGFYVIEQTGDTVKIDTPEGFVPKEW